MMRLRLQLHASSIDPESYCKAPGFWPFKLEFPPRTRPDDKANPPWSEETGEDAFLISTSGGARPLDGPPATSDNPLAAFCHLPIDLERAVRFVDYMIEIRLRDRAKHYDMLTPISSSVKNC
jgi:hypothetical protein